ncbi:hypothetical protein [Paenibacillus sp. 32O-W]|uniref:hypothetical protein n=1 Tax=Paenibacillus sp. 32O-W TaxID=1695218 RepID=UPI001C930903|nr:hypothetical protein [Paenibacillus sp. 32O-W]
MKKIVYLLTATTIIAGALAGCSKAPKEAAPSEGETAAQNSQNPYLASEKPLKLKVHMGTKDSGVFKNDWPIFVMAAEMTNVTLEGTLPSTVAAKRSVLSWRRVRCRILCKRYPKISCNTARKELSCRSMI